jgi:hypothetical protein
MGAGRRGAAALLTALAVVGAAVVVACAPNARYVTVHPGKHIVPVANARWRISSSQPKDGITGYADQASLSPGGSLHLFVSTSASSWTVAAYRMGWYDGKGGGKVWESEAHPGVVQPDPEVSDDTNTVVAPWTKPLTVRTAGWPEGIYLFVLSASDGSAHYVPVVLRSRSLGGKVVLLAATATWQAYNAWGGYSLYHGPQSNARKRAKVVSFDRPYDGSGADLFLTFEQPVIGFAEHLGLPLAYLTSQDLASQPDILAGARALISLGHDEYWTSSMRDALTTARDAGTNIAFLGANAMFRHIRFEDASTGPSRLEVNYRTEADPLMETDPSEVTTDWREPPQPRPESVLTGALYECNPVDAPFVVPEKPKWPLSAAVDGAGEEFKGLVGPEYDRVDPAFTTPRPITVLSHSPVTCRGRPSYADSSYYTVPGGAGVFDAGTMRWVCALGGGCRNHGVTAAATTFVQQVTAELLRAFLAGPVGKTHEAVDNVDDIGEFLGDATVRRYVPRVGTRRHVESVPLPSAVPHPVTTLPAPAPSTLPTSKPKPKPTPEPAKSG